MPKVSVIIPAYNAERTITETVNSVLRQTFADFELLVTDDGSTDGTREALARIEDSRLRVFSHTNGGVSAARNRGLRHATGEFIAFLDADDLWTPDKLARQVAALERAPEAGVAYSWTRAVDAAGRKICDLAPIRHEGGVLRKLLVTDFITNGSNVLVRRRAIESIGDFDVSLTCAADHDYWLRLAARWRFVVVPAYQVLYRQMPDSMSSRIQFIERELIKVIEKAYAAAPPEYAELKNASLAYAHRYIALKHMALTSDAPDIKKAGRQLRKAMRLHPPLALDAMTQRLFARWLLRRILPPHVAAGAVSFCREAYDWCARTRRNC